MITTILTIHTITFYCDNKSLTECLKLNTNVEKDICNIMLTLGLNSILFIAVIYKKHVIYLQTNEKHY